MQGELVGDFLETDLNMTFMTSFQDFSKSLNLFLLRIIFPDTMYYFASDGESLRSVASLELEFCMCEGRSVGTPTLAGIRKVMFFIIFEALRPDLRRISRAALRCRAMLKLTRRAFNL